MHVISDHCPLQVRRLWLRITMFSVHNWIKSNWMLSLFIGKCWRFGAGNRSCVLLFPWLCLRVSCQRVKEQSQTIYVCVWLWLCPWEKGKERVCWDVWKHSFYPANLCVFLWLSVWPHACTKEGKSYLLEQHPHAPPPTSLQLFIRHIIAEYKQRRRAFSCAAARLWSAGLPLPRIHSSNEGTSLWWGNDGIKTSPFIRIL